MTDKNKAILFMLISIIAFAVMNSVVKYLTSFSSYQIVFFRTIGTLVFIIPILIKRKINFLGNNRRLLFLRALFGVISLTCFFESLNHLDVGTAVSLRYTSPIFAAIFALIFLKEKVSFLQWILFLLAFIGVLFIKGFGENINTIGLLLIITSAIFLGLIFVVIRKIGNTENPLVIINYFMMFALVFGGILSINYWQTPNAKELLLLLSLGVFGYLGQLYMTKAFQLYDASVVAPLKYAEIIITICIGFFWFGDVYNIWTLLGIGLIMSGLFFNIIKK